MNQEHGMRRPDLNHKAENTERLTSLFDEIGHHHPSYMDPQRIAFHEQIQLSRENYKLI